MSNDKTAEDFLKEKGIIKEGYSKWICRFEDGKEFDIGELIRDYSAQQLKEYREKLKKKLNNFSKDKHGRIFTTEVIELIDQTDSTK